MSDNILTNSLFGKSNDFFTIPVDGMDSFEDNTTFSSEEDNNVNLNSSKNSDFSDFFLSKYNNNNSKPFYYNYDENDINNILNTNNSNQEIQEEIIYQNSYINNQDNIDNYEDINKNEETFYILSNLDKKKYNSQINSSKMYTCEFMKNNWKNRAKLFLNRMKKKYTKKVINNEI